ncbi:MAG TPA: hypothetical protein VJA16_13790 [Thermoanaerobaculia bacterium]
MRELKVTELVALVGVLVGGIARLGFATLRAREELLGIAPLGYPQENLVWAGANALAALPVRAVAAFLVHPVLRGSAAALLLLAVAFHATRWLVRCRGAAILALLAAAAIVLALGAMCYRIALRATDLVGEASLEGAPCGSGLGPNLAERMTFETCSWLTNESLANEQRREGFAGLLAWLMLACVAAIWTGARATGFSGFTLGLRGALVGLHVLLLLFLLYQLPRAHAYAEWGLRYPLAKVKQECAKDLAAEIANCCAFDVSAGAQKTTLLLRGSRCTPRVRGALNLGNGSDDGRSCLFAISRPRAITRGCED